MIQFVIVSLLALLSISSSALAQSCAADAVAVQILGSGGPRVNRDRASSSYLLWIDAQARIFVDIGGGAFLRFGQTQAKLSDLSLVAISHLHPDHVSDLPALLWLSHQARKDSLPIAGPSGNTWHQAFRRSSVASSMRRMAHFKCSVLRWVLRRARREEAFVSMSASLM
jgi:ribonuclease BN (tRNA processing enzyme)